MAKQHESASLHKRRLVQETAATLRDMILSREPGTQIGSLRELAQTLGVGIVTVQQAARILEHEGLLAVRRGPGGGYYGLRPDEAALERALSAYLAVHGFGYREALATTSLLDCEAISTAARCRDEALRDALRALSQRLGQCRSTEDRIAFEEDFREVLFKMARTPLLEFVSRVALRQYKMRPSGSLFAGAEGMEAWRRGRVRILQAVLDGDAALARFEADRYREEVLRRLDALTPPD